jgi:hypothetical protein
MLLSDWKFEDRGKFLVSSLIQSGTALDLSDIQGGLACELQFEFLPTGVFQRIVSLCAEYVDMSVEPGLSKNEAIFCFSDFFGLVQSDDGKTIRIMVSPDSERPVEIVKIVISMYRELSSRLMNSLDYTLTLESPKDKTMVKYQDIVQARSQRTKRVRAFQRNKMVNVDEYSVFFDESVGTLDSDADGPQVTRAPPLALSSQFRHHVFLSHKQKFSADMAALLYERLHNRGLKVWYDQEHKGNLAEEAMKCGIRESKCYLLVLAKDVFTSRAVKMELKTALELKKPVLLVHESKTDQGGFCDFGEHISSAPDFAKHLFNENESLPFRRRYYEKDAFLTELIHRIIG